MPDSVTRGFACNRGFVRSALLAVVLIVVTGQLIVVGHGPVIRARIGMGVDFAHRHRADGEQHHQAHCRHKSQRDAQADGQAMAEGLNRHVQSMTYATDVFKQTASFWKDSTPLVIDW